MYEVSRRRDTAAAVAAVVMGITGFAGLSLLVWAMPTVHGYPPGTALLLLASGAAYGLIRSRGIIRDIRLSAGLGRYQRRIVAVRALKGEKYRLLTERLETEAKNLREKSPFYGWGTLGMFAGVTAIALFALPGGPYLWAASLRGELLVLPFLWLLSAWGYTLMLYLITRSVSSRFSLGDMGIGTGLALFSMLVVPTGTILALVGHACARLAVLGVEPWAPHREDALPRSKALSRAAVAADPLAALRADLEQARSKAAADQQNAAIAQAVRDFLGRADPRQVADAGELLGAELREVAVTHPERVIRLLAEAPALRTPQVFDTAVGHWARTSAADEFDGTWDHVVAMATETAADPYRAIGRAVAAVPAEQVATLFRTRAAGRLFAVLDTSLDNAAPDLESPVWELLAQVAPVDAPQTPGGWLCALGDAAADRGATEAARSRYRSALSHGCADARPRAAHMAALAGHELLRAGAPSRAVAPLREAVDLVDAPDYRLLLAMAELGGSAAPDRETLEAAITREYNRDPYSATVRLLATLLALRLDDTDSALRLLRSAAQGPDAEQPEAAETAETTKLITAVLSGDGRGFAAAMAAVYGRHTDAWARQVPFDPATILAWSARTARSAADDQRLAHMFESLPGSGKGHKNGKGSADDGAHGRADVLRSIQVAAAHRILADVAAAMNGHSTSDRSGTDGTEQRLAVAESLLRGA